MNVERDGDHDGHNDGKDDQAGEHVGHDGGVVAKDVAVFAQLLVVALADRVESLLDSLDLRDNYFASRAREVAAYAVATWHAVDHNALAAVQASHRLANVKCLLASCSVEAVRANALGTLGRLNALAAVQALRLRALAARAWIGVALAVLGTAARHRTAHIIERLARLALERGRAHALERFAIVDAVAVVLARIRVAWRRRALTTVAEEARRAVARWLIVLVNWFKALAGVIQQDGAVSYENCSGVTRAIVQAWRRFARIADAD